MFIVTKYKVFESNNFSDDDIKLAQEIESKKDFIENEYELVVKHRQPFGDTIARRSGAKFFDISRYNDPHTSVGVYDIVNREFTLFWSEGKSLPFSKYLKIKSDTFFDQLERVYYLIFIEA
jgi:hypothetical protein